MNKVLALLKSGEFTVIAQAAQKYGVDRTTLSRRARYKTTSRAEANSIYRQFLTNPQEELLIVRINYFTRRNLSPSPRMVRNMAEEIARVDCGQNWTNG